MNFLKETDGKLSFTRLTGFILVLFYIGIASYSFFSKGEMVDLPTNLMIFVGGMYGFNKIGKK